MKKKVIELKNGQVWQVPDKKWIRVRMIENLFYCDGEVCVTCWTLGDLFSHPISYKAFLRWIRRNKLKKPIGMVDSKTGKVRVVK